MESMESTLPQILQSSILKQNKNLHTEKKSPRLNFSFKEPIVAIRHHGLSAKSYPTTRMPSS